MDVGNTGDVTFAQSEYESNDDDIDEFSNLAEALARNIPSPCNMEDKPKPNIVFVTSATGNGNLNSWTEANGKSGLEAGDTICQNLAVNAEREGTFRAWLSDKDNDAYCRIHELSGKKSNFCGQSSLPANAGPWVMRNSSVTMLPFSKRIDLLTADNLIYYPLRYDESGNLIQVQKDDAEKHDRAVFNVLYRHRQYGHSNYSNML